MVDPPVKECLIWYDIEVLFGGRSLGKRIRYIHTKYEQTFSRCNGVKDSGASLINTVSIGFVEYPCLTGARRNVTRSARLIPTVKSFYCICPHCTEHCSLRVNFGRVAKHPLCIILVQLHVFRCKPLIPIGLLDEFSTGELHHTSDDIVHPPIIDKLV
jgi:hypothetical protein